MPISYKSDPGATLTASSPDYAMCAGDTFTYKSLRCDLLSRLLRLVGVKRYEIKQMTISAIISPESPDAQYSGNR